MVWCYYLHFCKRDQPGTRGRNPNFSKTSSGGTYDWIEYSDYTKSTPIDQGSGQFTISDLSEQPDPVTVELRPEWFQSCCRSSWRRVQLELATSWMD